MAQAKLGDAYGKLLTGDRGENLKRSIAFFEAALRVYTEREFPLDWAKTLNNLGNAYRDLTTGNGGENLNHAIECYEATLRVFTEREFPFNWATAHSNLGIAYGDLPIGQRRENLERSVISFEAALRVLKDGDPLDWVGTNENLARACLLLTQIPDTDMEKIRKYATLAAASLETAARGYQAAGLESQARNAQERVALVKAALDQI